MKFKDTAHWEAWANEEAQRQEGPSADEITVRTQRNKILTAMNNLVERMENSSTRPAAPTLGEFRQVPGTTLQINLRGEIQRIAHSAISD